MTPPIVLHHYSNSPFAELARLALGRKGARYGRVEIPAVSPKPDLVALTGGYERTPVLQIGADIHCDTVAICAALEDGVNGPTLYPAPLGRAALPIALWAGGAAFGWAVGTGLGAVADRLPDAFWADRRARFGLDRDALARARPHNDAQFAATLGVIRDTLSDGRSFVGGDEPGHADLALYMLVWFQRMRGVAPAAFGEPIAGWAERVAAIGHGDGEDWTADQAIAAAREHEPVGEFAVEGDWSTGEQVAVRTDTPDRAAVTGTLVGLDDRRIVMERNDARAGRVRVHLPRMGQVLTRA